MHSDNYNVTYVPVCYDCHWCVTTAMCQQRVMVQPAWPSTWRLPARPSRCPVSDKQHSLALYLIVTILGVKGLRTAQHWWVSLRHNRDYGQSMKPLQP